MNNALVLGLFPGGGLFDKAFELEGFTVVKGPDVLFGSDVREFTAPYGVFDGIIGGPPCVEFSKVNTHERKREAPNLVAEFFRIVWQAHPRWWVMENVVQATERVLSYAPTAKYVDLSDWDCGGKTQRIRRFWYDTNFAPFEIVAPPKREGKGEKSVLASTHKQGPTPNRPGYLPGNLSTEEYAALQGAEYLVPELKKRRASKAFIVHLLGNGVPLAMGRHIAREVNRTYYGVDTVEDIDPAIGRDVQRAG